MTTNLNLKEIRYITGEVAESGDIVDDNGQSALVERVELTSPGTVLSRVDTPGEAKFHTAESAPGLHLNWDIGLPVFRPITSKNWGGVRFVRRALERTSIAHAESLPIYLVGFSYHEPEAWSLYKKGVIEDFESSTGIFVEASSQPEAIAWAEKIAEVLLRRSNSDDSLDWKALGYDCWVEQEPEASTWKHCLSFFQRVKIGVWPNFDEMGTAAYARWAEKNGIKYI